MTRKLTVLELCAELEMNAEDARPHADRWHHGIDHAGAGVRLRIYAGADARTGTTIAQAVPSAAADHIVATQPDVALALVAKLREADRLIALAARALDMLELDWHISELRVDLHGFGTIEVP